MKKYSKYIIISSILIIVLIICILMCFIKPKINIELNKELNKDNTKTLVINVKKYNFFKTECKIDNGKWKKARDNKCYFDVESGTYKITIKNLNNKVTKLIKVDVNGIKGFSLEGEKTYIALNETLKINEIFDIIGNPDKKIKWVSSNPDVVSIDEGIAKGLSLGEATISATTPDKKTDSIKVIVTDLIVPRKLNSKKSVIACREYTEEEAAILDDILKTRIENKGLKTRAALIEAIRFLPLSLEYKIPYFFENGRLNNYGRQHYVDGEGRYYNKGLYLSDSKKEDIKASFAGPAIWGCPLTNYDTSYGWVFGGKYPNGLDCSGFISWALYNAGMDIGDIGSGITNGIDDISDLGEMHELTYEFANSGKYKVGDIIARDGHTAMIAGIDDENIYIAESLLKGVVIEKFSYKNKNSKLYKLYGYINTLDNFYESDGIYDNMWLES